MSRLDNHGDETRSISSPSPSMTEDVATWWQRMFALVIDAVLIGAVALLTLVLTTLVAYPPTATPASASTTNPLDSGVLTLHTIYWYEAIGIGIASVLYFAILDGRSQTVGKMMVGIAVRDQVTGHSIGIPRALGRWMTYLALWAVFLIPGILNALSPIWDPRGQAWHDHAVGSIVLELD
jgi:hypothetical protein